MTIYRIYNANEKQFVTLRNIGVWESMYDVRCVLSDIRRNMKHQVYDPRDYIVKEYELIEKVKNDQPDRVHQQNIYIILCRSDA